MNKSNFFLKTTYSNLIRTIAVKIKLKSDQKINKLGLNSQQGRMIGYIYEHQDHGIIQKDLADVFQRKGASITSMLQGLERKGYIERRTPNNNQRQKNIYVLPKGADLIQDFNTVFEDIEQSITKNLTPKEKDILIYLLTKINQSL